MSASERSARILTAVDNYAEAMVSFAADLVRIPTVNPPGEAYADCAARIATEMQALGMHVDVLDAAGRPENTTQHPRMNVMGTYGSPAARPCVHLNGHFDVVPPGEGWTRDPFGGEVENGRLHGRGSADMKAGLAAATYAVAAVHRAGGTDRGRIEVSATVDEESGGLAGVAHLAQTGRISAERVDHVIIPEPFGVDRICVGHRGVYWFRVTARGRIGHGSMPFLGRSAINDLAVILNLIRTELAPAIARRVTAMPVVPELARYGSVNVNSILGGQTSSGSDGTQLQSPCVADRAEAVIDRRFLPEEDFEAVKAEIVGLLDRATQEDPERDYLLEDLLVVLPTQTPTDSPVTAALESAIRTVVGRSGTRVASPGTYDQKHFAQIAGVTDCVAYGPGLLEQAHQPDEFCDVADIVTSARVMALAIAELLDG